MPRLRQRLRLVLALLGRRLGQPEILDAAVLILTFLGAWLVALHQGGARAEGPVLGARLILAAACMHAAVAAARAEQGYRVLRGAWIILPFLGWLAVDAALLAPDRGAALEAWTIAALGGLAIWMTLCHARRTFGQAIALLLVVGPASLMASGAYDDEGGQVRALLGLAPDPAYSPHFSSAFGSPGACAAIMLAALLPALAAALNPRLRVWLRAVCGYLALLLFIGLHQTHHGWAWLGFAAGAAFAGHALRRKAGWSWADLRVAAALGLALAWLGGRFANLGVLRESAGTGETPLATAAWQGLLADPLAGGGHGSFILSFESVRPHGWQTDPAGPGSLLLQLVAEHGLLGLLLAAVPVAAVLAAAARASLERPPEGRPESPSAYQRTQLRRTMLAGGVGGVGAALWTLCFDHAGGQPGVVLIVLLALAVVHRAAATAEESRREWPARGRLALGIGAVALPALLTPVALAPLEAGAIAQPAVTSVQALSPTSIGGGVLLPAASEEALREALVALDRSLRLNPWHAGRASARAQGLALLTRQAPGDPALAGRALAEAARAVDLAPRLAWPRLVHGSILLGSLDAPSRSSGLSEIEAARAIAPRNQAVALRRAQALGQVATPTEELRSALEEARLTSPALPEIAQRLSLLPPRQPATR